MEDKQILLAHLDQVHTTELGAARIKENLKLITDDVVAYCKHKISDEKCHVYKKGKNWYCEIDQISITIHCRSYTIITAHRMD